MPHTLRELKLMVVLAPLMTPMSRGPILRDVFGHTTLNAPALSTRLRL
jgi:hypothetical protein